MKIIILIFCRIPSKIIEKITELNNVLNISLLNIPLSFYIPNDIHTKCLEERKNILIK